MKGIKMSDCKFYVNEEERIVVCVIPKTKYMVEDFIKDYLKENSMFVSTSTKDYSFMLGSKLLNAERFLNKQLKQVIQTGSSVTLIRKNDLHYSLINTIPLL